MDWMSPWAADLLKGEKSQKDVRGGQRFEKQMLGAYSYWECQNPVIAKKVSH